MKIFIAISAFLLFLASIPAREVTFAWDPNPEPDIAGYRLHWGYERGRYCTSVNVGNVTRHTIEFPTDVDIYTVVTAYNEAGLESLPSNVVFLGALNPEAAWIRRYDDELDEDGDGEPDGVRWILYVKLDPAEFPDLELTDDNLLLVWEYSTDLVTWTEFATGPASRALSAHRPILPRQFFRWRIINTSIIENE